MYRLNQRNDGKIVLSCNLGNAVLLNHCSRQCRDKGSDSKSLLTSEFIPCTSTLCGDMRQYQTMAPTAADQLMLVDAPSVVADLTHPIPARRLAQGLESSMPKPANDPSSR